MSEISSKQRYFFIMGSSIYFYLGLLREPAPEGAGMFSLCHGWA